MLKAANWFSRVKHQFLLVVSLVRVYSEAFGAQQCNPLQVRVHWGRTSLPLTLHLHTDWLRVRWPLFPHGGRAIRTCTSFRVTCLLWECCPMIGCAGACGCGLPCGCSEGGRRRKVGEQSEWLVKCETWIRLENQLQRNEGESWVEGEPSPFNIKAPVMIVSNMMSTQAWVNSSILNPSAKFPTEITMI